MDLEALRALVAVAGADSITAAARTAGLSRTTFRRRIEALAASLGTELVISDGRDIALTPVGQLVVERARAILEQTQALGTAVEEAITPNRGTIRAYLPTSLHPLSAVLVGQAVHARFPDLVFDAHWTPEPLDMLDVDGDLAIHWGPLPERGAQIARRMSAAPLRLLASRGYAEAFGVPQSIDDLASHRLLTFDGHGLQGDRLPLLDGGSVPVMPAARSNNIIASWEMARLGGGIALVPNVRLPGDGWLAEDVVVVLPEQVGHDLPQWVVGREALSRRPTMVPLLDELAALMNTILGSS